MKAENRGNEGFLQRASVEHQGYAEARSTDRREGKERGGASESVYPWMAWLLPCSRDEADDEVLG